MSHMTLAKKSALVALAALLAGCSGAPAASPTPTPQATYGHVVELKDAAVRAGYECSDWQQANIVTLAASSGTCSSADVFSVYLSSDAVQQVVVAQKGLPGDVHLLVGQNWIINAPAESLPALRDALGGQIVEQSS